MLKKKLGKVCAKATETTYELVSMGAYALSCTPSREQENGQSHILEIVVSILIVVVLGIFLYLTTVPEVKTLINNAMSTIGTIVPD